MPISCDKCGVTTEIPEAFFKQHRSFRRGMRTECPRCYSDAQLSAHRNGLWWILAGGVAGLILVFILPERRSGWIVLNIFFFQLFLLAAILPHEFGHAFAGRWLGLRVFKVYVGYGKTLFTRNLFGFPTEFRAIPAGGLTMAAPTCRHLFKLKMLTFIFAGAFANLILGAVALCFVPVQSLWDIGKITSSLVPGQMFVCANLFVLVQNLWPHSFASPAGKLLNDGKLIWQTLFAKQEVIDALMAARFAMEAKECHEKLQHQDALAWVEQGLSQHPENLLLLNWRGNLLLEDRSYEAARDCYIGILEREGNPPDLRGIMLNNIAYVDAVTGGPERLAEADRYSQEAMSLLGWIPAVRGTRGTTLLELGQIDEALKLLRQSMAHADHASGKAQNACFIAIGEARRGNLAESQRYLEEARRIAPCFLLERAEEALRAAASAHTI